MTESEYREISEARDKVIDLLHNEAKYCNELYPAVLPILDYAYQPMNFPDTTITGAALRIARIINKRES